MTAAAPARAASPSVDAGIETPTLRRTARRIWPWLALVLAVVLVTVVLVAVALQPQANKDALAADNPGANGAEAVAQVLQQHGVDVTITHSLDRTEGAVRDPRDTTVLVYDPQELLTPAQHRRLHGAVRDLVLVEPGFATLEDLAPGVDAAGRSGTTRHADCDIAAVRAAGAVTDGGRIYHAERGSHATSCLRGDGGAALVRLTVHGVRTTVLGTGAALRNDTITKRGDAALALHLLGEHHALVWYLPGADDLAEDEPPSLADLTPPWVTPLVVLLLLGALAAAVWRGRRLGRVVVENLPVTVRASETMEGRARLYERAGARAHALDAIRIGTVDRLARMVGLPRRATAQEVVDAVATLTGRPRPEVAAILVDTLPTSDARLVALSDALLRLEHDTAKAVRP
jgi:protein-S-isoprenylcysteine O-methyltransferase Ste14